MNDIVVKNRDFGDLGSWVFRLCFYLLVLRRKWVRVRRRRRGREERERSDPLFWSEERNQSKGYSLLFVRTLVCESERESEEWRRWENRDRGIYGKIFRAIEESEICEEEKWDPLVRLNWQDVIKRTNGWKPEKDHQSLTWSPLLARTTMQFSAHWIYQVLLGCRVSHALSHSIDATCQLFCWESNLFFERWE